MCAKGSKGVWMPDRNGWSLLNPSYRAPSPWKKSGSLNPLVTSLVGLIVALPFFLSLTALYLFRRKNLKPKMLYATHPILFSEYKPFIAQYHSATLFSFNEHFANINTACIDKSAKDLLPAFLHGFDTRLFGSYIGFLWAIRHFDIFHLFFDGGFLDRTPFWRLEPLIYKLFGKKTIIYHYGGDIWTAFQNRNLIHKVAQNINERGRNFLLDRKKIRRIYLWSEHADFVIAQSYGVEYLPRTDLLIYANHILTDKERYSYAFDSTEPKVKIFHSASIGFRKGSPAIRQVLENLQQRHSTIECHISEGLRREEYLHRLDEMHIFIEQLTDGFISFTAIEAMLKGKIVVTHLDPQLVRFYKQLDYAYYERFFRTIPIIDASVENLEEKIEALLADREGLAELSRQNREFALQLLHENETMYRQSVDAFIAAHYGA